MPERARASNTSSENKKMRQRTKSESQGSKNDEIFDDANYISKYDCKLLYVRLERLAESSTSVEKSGSKPGRCVTPYRLRSQSWYHSDTDELENLFTEIDSIDVTDEKVPVRDIFEADKQNDLTEHEENQGLASKEEETVLERYLDLHASIAVYAKNEENFEHCLEKDKHESAVPNSRKRRMSFCSSESSISSKTSRRSGLQTQTRIPHSDDARAMEIARISRPRTRLGRKIIEKNKPKELVVMLERIENCKGPLIRKWQNKMMKRQTKENKSSSESGKASNLNPRGFQMPMIAPDIVMCEDESEEDDDEIMQILMVNRRTNVENRTQTKQNKKSPVPRLKQARSHQSKSSSVAHDPNLEENKEHKNHDDGNIHDPLALVEGESLVPEKIVPMDDPSENNEKTRSKPMTNPIISQFQTNFKASLPYNNEEIIARKKLTATKNAMVVLTQISQSNGTTSLIEPDLPPILVERDTEKKSPRKEAVNEDSCQDTSDLGDMGPLYIDEDSFEGGSDSEIELTLIVEEVECPVDTPNDKVTTDANGNEHSSQKVRSKRTKDNNKRRKDSSESERQSEENQKTPGEFECPKCESVFVDAESLENHRTVGGPCSSLVCTGCEATFEDAVGLTRHQSACTEKRSQKSAKAKPKPSNRPKTSKPLVKKSRLLSRVKNNKCNVCGIEFPTKVDLSIHLYKHSSAELQKAFQTAKAKEAASTPVNDAETSNGATPDAETSEESRVTVGNVLEAVAAVSLTVCPCHRDVDAKNLGESDLQIEMVLVCKLCSVIFRRLECLEIHYRDSTECARNRRDRDPKLFCATCQRCLNNWADMRQHLEVHASENAERTIRFMCNICRVVFVGFGSLFYNHWQSHVRDSLFIAGKYNFPRYSLQPVDGTEKLPVGARSNEKYLYVAEHVCQSCRKPFSMKRDLECHLRSKSCANDRLANPSIFPVRCDACAASFYSKEKFLEHAKNVHKDRFAWTPKETQALECTRCRKAFSSVKAIDEHWSKTHTAKPVRVVSTINQQPSHPARSVAVIDHRNKENPIRSVTAIDNSNKEQPSRPARSVTAIDDNRSKEQPSRPARSVTAIDDNRSKEQPSRPARSVTAIDDNRSKEQPSRPARSVTAIDDNRSKEQPSRPARSVTAIDDNRSKEQLSRPARSVTAIDDNRSKEQPSRPARSVTAIDDNRSKEQPSRPARSVTAIDDNRSKEQPSRPARSVTAIDDNRSKEQPSRPARSATAIDDNRNKEQPSRPARLVTAIDDNRSKEQPSRPARSVTAIDDNRSKEQLSRPARSVTAIDDNRSKEQPSRPARSVTAIDDNRSKEQPSRPARSVTAIDDNRSKEQPSRTARSVTAIDDNRSKEQPSRPARSVTAIDDNRNKEQPSRPARSVTAIDHRNKEQPSTPVPATPAENNPNNPIVIGNLVPIENLIPFRNAVPDRIAACAQIPKIVAVETLRTIEEPPSVKTPSLPPTTQQSLVEKEASGSSEKTSNIVQICESNVPRDDKYVSKSVPVISISDSEDSVTSEPKVPAVKKVLTKVSPTKILIKVPPTKDSSKLLVLKNSNNIPANSKVSKVSTNRKILKSCLISKAFNFVSSDISFEEERWKWWLSTNSTKKQGFLRVKTLSELQAVKNHVCSFCCASFERKESLVEHARTHLSNRPENSHSNGISGALVLPEKMKPPDEKLRNPGSPYPQGRVMPFSLPTDSYVAPQMVQVAPNEGIVSNPDVWIPVQAPGGGSSYFPAGSEVVLPQMTTFLDDESMDIGVNEFQSNVVSSIGPMNPEIGMHSGNLSSPHSYHHVLPPMVMISNSQTQSAAAVTSRVVAPNPIPQPRDYFCNVCQMRFFDLNTLKDHAMKHVDDLIAANSTWPVKGTSGGSVITNSQSTEPDSSNVVFVCAICKTSFYKTTFYKTHNVLRSHVALFHGITDLNNLNIDNIAVKSYHCSQCLGTSAVFDSEERYREHVNSIHKHACPLCKRIFLNFISLREHLAQCRNYSSNNSHTNTI